MRHVDLCRFDQWEQFYNYAISLSNSSIVLISCFVFLVIAFFQLQGKTKLI
jgi:hypothetical protein